MGKKQSFEKVLWTSVVFLAFLGAAVAARRTIVLINPGAVHPNKNPAATLDQHFAKEKTLTLLHVIPGMLFMVLGPLQFVRRLRIKRPAFHRWSGRIFLAASATVGLTGIAMALLGTIGGWDEKSAILLFGTFLLIALGRALWHVVHHEFAKHREWMIRGFAVGLAVATIRPIIGGFFALAVMQGHTPEPSKFFGPAFWIGFTAQTVAAEIGVRHTRAQAEESGGTSESRQF